MRAGGRRGEGEVGRETYLIRLNKSCLSSNGSSVPLLRRPDPRFSPLLDCPPSLFPLKLEPLSGREEEELLVRFGEVGEADLGERRGGKGGGGVGDGRRGSEVRREGGEEVEEVVAAQRKARDVSKSRSGKGEKAGRHGGREVP